MKLDLEFFNRDVLIVAPELVGKLLVRKYDDGSIIKLRISETEAYRGEEDKACHASKGITPRTEVMYSNPGSIYIYLIYGMYWMFNIVTEKINIPQAVLLRGAGEFNGPGKLTKALKITKEFNNLNISDCPQIWIEDDAYIPKIKTLPRVGIDYAGKEWASKPWRFVDKNYIVPSSAKI
ncbi:MAG: DNA-3-methyladenine glycosylase [Bacteroidales bacterium]|nr:DNA-3-methyladenine glycosylase [Bacteroidales bacterium]MDD3859113.1 DNA-3-methyladenine glycosylase [Bacteroidales bacterium]